MGGGGGGGFPVISCTIFKLMHTFQRIPTHSGILVFEMILLGMFLIKIIG